MTAGHASFFLSSGNVLDLFIGSKRYNTSSTDDVIGIILFSEYLYAQEKKNDKAVKNLISGC
ncbi:hypothetical protein VRK_39790 [Vibrio sp. MEBiC08052]|nr:hypothetical protein VRK_39790 [Vibrio sp. MEBiC08052]